MKKQHKKDHKNRLAEKTNVWLSREGHCDEDDSDTNEEFTMTDYRDDDELGRNQNYFHLGCPPLFGDGDLFLLLDLGIID